MPTVVKPKPKKYKTAKPPTFLQVLDHMFTLFSGEYFGEELLSYLFIRTLFITDKTLKKPADGTKRLLQILWDNMEYELQENTVGIIIDPKTNPKLDLYEYQNYATQVIESCHSKSGCTLDYRMFMPVESRPEATATQHKQAMIDGAFDFALTIAKDKLMPAKMIAMGSLSRFILNWDEERYSQDVWYKDYSYAETSGVNAIIQDHKAHKGLMYTLKALQIKERPPLKYQWVTDIQFIIDKHYEMLVIDTETTGLLINNPDVYPLCMQIAVDATTAYAIPLRADYYPELKRDQEKLLEQVRTLAKGSTRFVGHNIKFDLHMLDQLGITFSNVDDTMVMGHILNTDNTSNLNDNVKEHCGAEYFGLNDELEKVIDKSDMVNLDKETMLQYSCNDVVMTYVLYEALHKQLEYRPSEARIYNGIHRPALITLAYCVEKVGQDITPAWDAGVKELEHMADNEFATMVSLLPDSVIEKYGDDILKESTWSKVATKKDILFGKDGFALPEKVFTKSGEVSLNVKKHLSKHKGEFIESYSRLASIKHSLNTMVSYKEKFIRNNKLTPTYNLAGTATLRLSSANPNAQNYPAHGDVGKVFKKALACEEGYLYLKIDISQMELRLAACLANCKAAINAYLTEGDLHIATAAMLLSKTIEEFKLLDKSEQKAARQNAKGVNFGLVYGGQAKMLKEYLELTYGIIVTLEEAEDMRDKFFKTYPEFLKYAEKNRRFVKKHGYILGMAGNRYDLPNVYSPDGRVSSNAVNASINYPIQGIGGLIGIMYLNMVREYAESVNAPNAIIPINNTHDSVTVKIKETHLEHVKPIIRMLEEDINWSTFGVEMNVPWKVEALIGKDLYNMELVEL